MKFKHYPVMLKETVDFLNVKKGGIYVDCTLGGGGHSGEVLKRLEKTGRLISIDRDLAAIDNAKRIFSDADNFTAIHSSFDELGEILETLNIEKIDGIMMDLGVSSYQIDNPDRGFSYMTDAPLDMRMDDTVSFSAYDVVNGYSEEKLTDIFFTYGEERHSRRIAAAIVKEREAAPIKTTGLLSQIITSKVPAYEKGGHPAKRCFQAIRIEVNNELRQIEPTIRTAVDKLGLGGRIAIISFHSLEDAIVKKTFVSLAKGCTCPKDFPVCVCGKKPEIEILTKKPVLPSETELSENSRSASAKLRAALKL